MPNDNDLLAWDNTRAGTLAEPKCVWRPPPGLACAPTVFHPKGCSAMDPDVAALLGLDTDTTEVSEESRGLYLGRAQAPFTAAQVVIDVVGLPAKPPLWSELAICKGNPVLCDGPSNLTRLGWRDTTADWSVPGPVATVFGGLGVAPGDHLWVVWAQKEDPGGGLTSFRAFLPNVTLTGLFVFLAGTRPSTMAAATAFNRVGSTVRPINLLAGFS